MSAAIKTVCACCDVEFILDDRTVFDTELNGHVCEECKWHLRNAVAQLKLRGIRGCVREELR